MIDMNAFSNLEKAIDNMAKTLEGFYNDWNALPKYLRNEMLHLKKKPRGSIRRKRNGSDSE